MAEFDTSDLTPNFLNSLDESFEKGEKKTTGIVFGEHGFGVVEMIFKDSLGTYFGDVRAIEDEELNQYSLITRLSRGDEGRVNWQLFKGWIVEGEDGYAAVGGERRKDAS